MRLWGPQCSGPLLAVAEVLTAELDQEACRLRPTVEPAISDQSLKSVGAGHRPASAGEHWILARGPCVQHAVAQRRIARSSRQYELRVRPASLPAFFL